MKEKIEEMEFKRGSRVDLTRANTFASTARGGFAIFMLGNPSQEKSHGGVHRQAFSPRIHVMTKLLVKVTTTIGL